MIRSEADVERLRLALVPADEAFWSSEAKWGVGRLERLVSHSTLAAWQRGWAAYRSAIEAGDAEAVGAVAPKMVQALAFMDAEAGALGHLPLAPETWECPLGDDFGTVLVVVRTQAEQAAVLRSAREAGADTFSAAPGGGLRALSASPGGQGAVNGSEAPADDPTGGNGLPPDVMLTVRGQHEGRALEVWTLGEIARLILAHGSVARDARKWEGTPAASGAQGHEGDAADLVRSGYPLPQALLDF